MMPFFFVALLILLIGLAYTRPSARPHIGRKAWGIASPQREVTRFFLSLTTGIAALYVNQVHSEPVGHLLMAAAWAVAVSWVPGAFRQSRRLGKVPDSLAEVFDGGLARTLAMAGQLHSTQRRVPDEAAPAREPDADELEVVREFFTLAIDMEPEHRAQLRWVFAYSGSVPYFIDALRLFPAVSDAMEGDWQKASRFWMDGKYMSYAIRRTTDLPRDYALAMYPIVPPTLRYPL